MGGEPAGPAPTAAAGAPPLQSLSRELKYASGLAGWVLPNGLRLVAEPMPAVRSVAVGVWILAGSRHERPAEHGISHFVEHLMFKGTHKRTAREIAEVMDQVGGQLNAFTTKEYTCYHARVLDDHLPLAIEVLADMLRGSMYRAEDIEREKGVVVEEIGMYEDTPDELVHDMFAQAVWQTHPLGRSVLGVPGTVCAFDRPAIVDYLATAYTPPQAVIAVAGSCAPPAVLALCEEAFGDWRGDGSAVGQERPEVGVNTLLRPKDTELVHVVAGGTGLPLGDPATYGLNIMSNILGGGPSSRLFQGVREERGLAYSVFSYTAAYQDSGVFAIYCGAGPERIAAALEVIGDELRQLAAAGVTAAELSRAKEQLKSNITLALESTSARMNRIGRSQLLLGKVVSIDTILARIEAVTVEDVQALAGAFCHPDRLSLAAIGPRLDQLGLRSALAQGIK